MRRTFWSLVATAALALVPYQSVVATNLLGHRAGYDQYVTVAKMFLTNQMDFAVEFNVNFNWNPTDINSNGWIWVNDSGKEADVYDANYSATWYGKWTCLDFDWSVCRNSKVQINMSYGPYTDTEAKSLVCEEMGHAVGLAHREVNYSSCMKRPVCWSCTFLGDPHDVDHLDAIY